MTGQFEGHVVPEERAVHPVGQQHPVFGFSGADEIGLFLEFEGQGLLGVHLEGGIAVGFHPGSFGAEDRGFRSVHRSLNAHGAVFCPAVLADIVQGIPFGEVQVQLGQMVRILGDAAGIDYLSGLGLPFRDYGFILAASQKEDRQR